MASPTPRQPRSRLRAFGQGYMLFGLDLDALGDENASFEGDVVEGSMPEGQITVLEWEPQDQALVTRFVSRLESLSRYWVAGSGYSRYFKDAFGVLGPFDKAPTKFLEWTGAANLNVMPGSVDMALCSSKAARELGPGQLDKVLRDTAAALKPTGRLILFLPAGDDALQGLGAYFDLVETRLSKEGDVEALLLVPKPEMAAQPAAAPAKRRRRRRRKPAAAEEG